MKKEYSVRWLNTNYAGGAHWWSCYDQERKRNARFTWDEARAKADALWNDGKKVRIYKGTKMIMEL